MPGSDLIDIFRTPDFNVAEFVRDSTGQGQDSIARLTARLEDCASVVEEELRSAIISCHEELLQNASNVSHLEGEIGDIRQSVNAIKASVATLHGNVLVPFKDVKRRALLLERMQASNVLIRKLLRFLFDARKLRTQMDAPARDYSKAAHTLHELEVVLQENQFERITVLTTEVVWIRETGQRVRRQAEEDFRSGLRQGNQIALNSALQVFFNLQCLCPQLKRLLGEMLEEFARQSLIAGSSFQTSLELNLQLLVSHMQRFVLLDDLVRTKVDPLTHRGFASALEQEGIASVTAYVWEKVTAAFAAKFGKVTQDRASRKALVSEVPKILSALTDATDKVNSCRRQGQILSATERDAFYAVVGSLREEFLGESVGRLTAPVEMMLPDKLLSSVNSMGEHRDESHAATDGSMSDRLPTTHDLRRYVQLLVAELERCECCSELLKDALRNVRSSLLLFAHRLEQLIDSSCLELKCFEDEMSLRLRSPLPLPARGHARNARLFGVSHHMLTLLKDVPSRFQAMATHQVKSALQQTSTTIISPVIGTLRRAVRNCAGQLEAHLRTAGMNDGSPAWVAFGQLCAHVNQSFFSLFGSGQLQPHIKAFIAFVLRLFMSAAVLLKPWNEAARGALVQDMQLVERTVATLDADFQVHVAHEASIFKAFPKLLFSDAFGQAEFQELTNVVPPQLLYTFLVHRLPPDAPSMPQFLGVTSGSFLDGTLMPLWDEEARLSDFKASVSKLITKHGDDAESASLVFLFSQTQ